MISDHFDGKKFFNPHHRKSHGFFSALKMLATYRPTSWPRHVENRPDLNLNLNLSPSDVGVTFVNHATVLIQLPGLNILTDPVWSKRASPVMWAGPQRVRAPGIDLEALPPIHLVLVSHNHYDHLDIETLRKISAKHSPRILVAMGDKKLLNSHGIEEVQEMDWWDKVSVDPQTQVHFAPTQHFSSRGLTDRFRSLWGSFMICRGQHAIYFGGDAGYSPHFKEIKQRIGAPTLAFLPIGAYEPRWFMGPVHMNPSEAVKAHQDLGSAKSIAIHFRCFQLTEEGIDRPELDLKEALVKAHLSDHEFSIVDEGRTAVFSTAAQNPNFQAP